MVSSRLAPWNVAPTMASMVQDTESEIRRIIREQFHVPEGRIKSESSFVDDLGADSLRLVKMTLVLEETFDIDIEDADVEKIVTVQDAIDYVQERVRPAT